MQKYILSLVLLLGSLISFAGEPQCPPWDIMCKHADTSVPTDEESAKALLGNLDKLRGFLLDSNVIVSKKLYLLGLTDNSKGSTEAIEFCYAVAGLVEPELQSQFEIFQYEQSKFNRFVIDNFSGFELIREKTRQEINFMSTTVVGLVNASHVKRSDYQRIERAIKGCHEWLNAYKNYNKFMA